MNTVQTPAQACARRVHTVDVDHLINRLTGLARRHEECGRISHALGVRSAIEQIKRDLSGSRKTAKEMVMPVKP